MSQITILTSAFNPDKYLDQYLTGISHLKSLKNQINISLAFGCISECDQKHIDEIAERVNNVCRDAGVKLYFYQNEPGTKENYSQTINRLVSLTIQESQNFAIWNLDDYRFPNSLLEQAKTLDAGADFTWGDYACVNNIPKSISGTPLDESGFFYEQTYPFIDYSNKRQHYQQFKYGCFLAWKAAINYKVGVYDEIFQSASDFDFINRLIFHDYKGVKTEGLMGHFLSIGEGISTRPNTVGHQEGIYILNRYLLDKFPIIVNYNQKILWRNLKK